MEENNNRLGFNYVMILLFILGFISLFFNTDTSYGISKKISSESNLITEEYILSECQSKTAIEASICLRNIIEPIFKFNKTLDMLNLSLQEIQIRGGDCKNWAELYADLGQKLGYNSYTFIIDIDGKNGHMFTVIGDDKGYCYIDQLVIDCFNYERGVR